MRVNVYAEEMSNEVSIVKKEIDGVEFIGLRFYTYLPVTNSASGAHCRGPFIHGPGDDDSSAVTFWGEHQLRKMLHTALNKLDEHYATKEKGETNNG